MNKPVSNQFRTAGTVFTLLMPHGNKNSIKDTGRLHTLHILQTTGSSSYYVPILKANTNKPRIMLAHGVFR